jgi:hypothetical protein
LASVSDGQIGKPNENPGNPNKNPGNPNKNPGNPNKIKKRSFCLDCRPIIFKI